MPPRKRAKLLVINPNTSVSVTEALQPIVDSLGLEDVSISYWTSPSGPTIIKTDTDIAESVSLCMQELIKVVSEYDGFLTACYADHPLTPTLQSYVQRKPVVGVFDASITTALHVVLPGSKFGIVTTGSSFEPLIAQGVRRVLGIAEGAPDSEVFGGVVASGVTVEELSVRPQTKAKEKIIAATRRLVKSGDIGVVCLGGAILVGLADWVREACILELGDDKGQRIRIVDQILAGMVTLYGMIRTDSCFNY